MKANTIDVVEVMARAVRSMADNVDAGELLDEFAGYGRDSDVNLLARSALEAIRSAGYVVVPVEPTEVMIEAGIKQSEECTVDWTASAACIGEHCYRAMIAAAEGGE